MLYSEVVDCYQKLEATTSRNEMISLFSNLLKKTPKTELPILVYLTQGKIAPDYAGVETGVAEKLAARALAKASGTNEAEIIKQLSSSGDIGEVAAKVMKGKTQLPLQQSQPLELKDVYDALHKIASTTGKNSTEAKLNTMVQLINSATPEEAKFVVRTAVGQLRLGTADYTVIGAIAQAFDLGKDEVENAYNLTSDLGFVAEVAAKSGKQGIASIQIAVGKPCRPMLAERLPSAKEIVEKMGKKSVSSEYKLDGERAQIHKGKDVVIYSRRLEQITSQYPDVVELVKSHVTAREAILDSEIVAYNEESGEYLPFQELMHRRRKHGIEKAMEEYPVTVNFFDVLFVDKDLTSKSYADRRKTLESIVKQDQTVRIVPSLQSPDPEEIERFMAKSISEGGEGLVLKDPSGKYVAGGRGFYWIKLKREYRSELVDTMDLAVVGAFHGRGKRAGSYGAFLLAAYDKDMDVFSSVTKVGTGFNDEHLKKFPELLKKHQSGSKPARVDSGIVPDVWFLPSVVIEILATELTLSPIHRVCFDKVRKGFGLALRFPRFTGKIRDDKAAEDSTTATELLEMYNLQLKKVKS